MPYFAAVIRLDPLRVNPCAAGIHTPGARAMAVFNVDGHGYGLQRVARTLCSTTRCLRSVEV